MSLINETLLEIKKNVLKTAVANSNKAAKQNKEF